MYLPVSQHVFVIRLSFRFFRFCSIRLYTRVRIAVLKSQNCRGFQRTGNLANNKKKTCVAQRRRCRGGDPLRGPAD